MTGTCATPRELHVVLPCKTREEDWVDPIVLNVIDQMTTDAIDNGHNAQSFFVM